MMMRGVEEVAVLELLSSEPLFWGGSELNYWVALSEVGPPVWEILVVIFFP